MKKIIIIFLMIITLFAPVKVSAIEENTYQNQIDKIAQENNIDTQGIMSISISDVINIIMEQVKESLGNPLSLFYQISAVIILCSLLNVFETNSSSSINQIINSLCVVVIFIAMMSPFKILVDSVANNLIDIKNFMITFLPVFSGISMASGEFITSTIYTGFFLLSLVFISDICIKYILPSINLYLALTVTNATTTGIQLKSLCDLYLKVIKWILRGLVSTVCFILTIQTTITQSQDNLALKAGKAVVSTVVPVVGPALKEAVSSVYASMEVVKGFAGAVGIIGILYIFLPSIVLLALYWFSTSGLIVVSEILNNKQAKSMMEGFRGVIELLLSIVFLFVILLVFSLTIMIKITQGV